MIAINFNIAHFINHLHWISLIAELMLISAYINFNINTSFFSTCIIDEIFLCHHTWSLTY